MIHTSGAPMTAGPVVDAVDVGFQPHLAGAEVQVPPAAPGGVVAGPGGRTAGAAQPAPSAAQPDDEALVGERHRAHRRAGQLEDPVECRGKPHAQPNDRTAGGCHVLE